MKRSDELTKVLSDLQTPQEVVDSLYEASEEAAIRLLAAKRGLSPEAWKRAVAEEKDRRVLRELLERGGEEGIRYFCEVRPESKPFLLQLRDAPVPEDLIEGFLKDPDENVRFAALSRFSHREWVVERALREWGDWGKEALLRVLEYGDSERGGPALIARFLAKDPDPEVRRRVAQNSEAPLEVILDLAKDPDPRVRYRAAINSKFPKDLLGSLADDPESNIRGLSTWSKDRKVLLRLINDPVPSVVSEALVNGMEVLSFDEVAHLLHHPDPDVVKWVIKGWGEFLSAEEVLGVVNRGHPEKSGIYDAALDFLIKRGLVPLARGRTLLALLKGSGPLKVLEVLDQASFDADTLREFGKWYFEPHVGLEARAPYEKLWAFRRALMRAFLRTEGILLQEIEELYKNIAPSLSGKRKRKERFFGELISPPITPAGQLFLVKRGPKSSIWSLIRVPVTEEVLHLVFKRIRDPYSKVAAVKICSPLPSALLEKLAREAIGRRNFKLIEELAKGNSFPRALAKEALEVLTTAGPMDREIAVHFLLRNSDVSRGDLERFLLEGESLWEVSGAFLGALGRAVEEPDLWPLLRRGAQRLIAGESYLERIRSALAGRVSEGWGKDFASPHLAPSFLRRVLATELADRATVGL